MVDLNSDYQVINFTVGPTKAGTKMGKLQLKNLSDDTVLNCVLWEEALNRIDDKVFRNSNTVKIKSGTYNEQYNNCNISSIELIEEAKLGLDEKQQEEYYAKVLSYVDKIENAKLKTFVKNTLSENKELLKITPAAKAMHHNFLGGLLVHTFECAEFAEILVPKLGGVSKDELFAACILHDIGKIFEYKINPETGLIEVNEDFIKDWISHSQYGFTLCMGAGFDKVAKMIASHHARIEWGALIDLDRNKNANRQDPENYQYIVHHIDDLSAKFGKITVKDI